MKREICFTTYYVVLIDIKYAVFCCTGEKSEIGHISAEILSENLLW